MYLYNYNLDKSKLFANKDEFFKDFKDTIHNTNNYEDIDRIESLSFHDLEVLKDERLNNLIMKENELKSNKISIKTCIKCSKCATPIKMKKDVFIISDNGNDNSNYISTKCKNCRHEIKIKIDTIL